VNQLASIASCLHLFTASSFALLTLNYRHLKFRIRELQKMSSKGIEKESIGDDADLSVMTFDM
jgi:hypothetical protein